MTRLYSICSYIYIYIYIYCIPLQDEEAFTSCAGRVQAICLFKLSAVALLAFMGLCPAIWTNLAIIVPVFVVRTAIMNSAFPLQKSILMDYVPKVSLCHLNASYLCYTSSRMSATVVFQNTASLYSACMLP